MKKIIDFEQYKDKCLDKTALGYCDLYGGKCIESNCPDWKEFPDAPRDEA